MARAKYLATFLFGESGIARGRGDVCELPGARLPE